MHKLITIIILSAAVTASADVLDKKARAFFNNRRICVKRDTTTKPGYVITHWERNGRPDTKAPAVVTNQLFDVLGKKQENPLENELKPLRKMEKARKKAWKKDKKNLEKLIDNMEKARKKSSAEMADLYTSMLEILMNAVTNI